MLTMLATFGKRAGTLARAARAVPKQLRASSSSTPAPYADGKFEHADGSPVDITKSFATGGVGGGSNRYARGWDNIFSKDKNAAHEDSEGEAGDYELFEPSEEWQEVGEGHICPGGLEYRLNLDTGEKLARLPPGTRQEEQNVTAEIAVVDKDSRSGE